MVKVTDYIAQYLTNQGVRCVYEMSGGMITHLLDSCFLNGAPRLVSVHHEQTAAFAADAAGRMSGVPGVAMATSGPGATNLLTGIGSCYFDSAPAVFITGQVNRHEQKGNRPIRQLGFQETDIVAMAEPITKAAWRVTDPEQVPEMLERAFALATEGRPGPVLLDIPMDVQRAMIDPETAGATRKGSVTPAGDTQAIQAMFQALRQASRPLILVGGGVRSGNAVAELRQLTARLGVPVVNSLMGVDVLPYNDPLRIGMIGSYGNRWANMAIAQADFLLVLGSRLDVRQTGSETESFRQGKVIFHVDCESGEINNRVVGCQAILSELKPFLASASALLEKETPLPSYEAWLKQIHELREEWSDEAELNNIVGINPNRLMHRLSRKAENASTYVIDVGQHQMWAAQSIEVGPDQRYLTSGGMGSMGFALPAAIGAATTLGDDSRPVIVIAGDGGFQTNIQELQTVRRGNLPIKMVILDNGCHGMVRQFQESYFDSRYQSTVWGYSAPDFAAVAQAYGIPALTVSDPLELDKALENLMGTEGPALLNVKIDTQANAYPKMAFGRPISDMEPFCKPLDMEGT